MWAKRSYGYKKRAGDDRPRELDDDVGNAVNFMVGLLAKREYSLKDLEEKARSRYTQDAIDEALQKCVDNGYQSEERYAQMLIRHMEFALYGPNKLAFEARRKGVSLELIRENSQEVDWDELAYEALVKKYGVVVIDYQSAPKAMAYLARRGFNSSSCSSALRRLKAEALEAAENEDEE